MRAVAQQDHAPAVELGALRRRFALGSHAAGQLSMSIAAHHALHDDDNFLTQRAQHASPESCQQVHYHM